MGGIVDTESGGHGWDGRYGQVLKTKTGLQVKRGGCQSVRTLIPLVVFDFSWLFMADLWLYL